MSGGELLPREAYEAARRELDDQLRADVELLYQAYLRKVRALDTVWGLDGGEGQPLLPPPPALPALPPGERAPAALPAAEEPAVRPASPAPPKPAPSPPAPAAAPAKSREPYEVYDDLLQALAAPGKLGERFDRSDLQRAIGYEARRTTFYRALDLLQRDGKIELAEKGGGRQPSRFKRPPAP
jgi:hypothetical protein